MINRLKIIPKFFSEISFSALTFLASLTEKAVGKSMTQTKELNKLRCYAKENNVKFIFNNRLRNWKWSLIQQSLDGKNNFFIRLNQKDLLAKSDLKELALAHELGHFISKKEGRQKPICPFGNKLHCQILIEDKAWQNGLELMKKLSIKFNERLALRVAYYFLNQYINIDISFTAEACLESNNCLNHQIFYDSLLKKIRREKISPENNFLKIEELKVITRQ